MKCLKLPKDVAFPTMAVMLEDLRLADASDLNPRHWREGMRGIGLFVKVDDRWHPIAWMHDDCEAVNVMEDGIDEADVEEFITESRRRATRNCFQFIEPDLKEIMNTIRDG